MNSCWKHNDRMNLLEQFKSFFIPKIVFKTNSKINGEIRVVEQFGKRTILVGGLQQSGDLVEMLWEKAIKKVTSYELKVTRVLILGLGGGSAAKVVQKYFPHARITGVELDPAMVEIGKKYFHLNSNNITVSVADAFEFVKRAKKGSFDLILVDLYIGKSTPAFLESDDFLHAIEKILTSDGFVIFNRLRGKKKEKELVDFKIKLESMFDSVLVVKPLINSLFIASKQSLLKQRLH